MDVWTGFYEKLFNFRQIRFFDIEGRASGLFSRALTSPDGKIRIPINEDAGDSGQIEEYLNIYRGEGIQHIACGVKDIYHTIEKLRAEGLPFMPPPPDTYFEKIDTRLPKHGEDGFGEGNFKALFESIEEDQIRRGVLSVDKKSAA